MSISGNPILNAPDHAALDAVATIPRDADGPVFSEPWQAQAFAMAVSLHERGLFTWVEWAETIAAEIKAAQAAGDPDRGDTYYRHWLAALERLVTEKRIVGTAALQARKDEWDRAAKSTPHGQPITLARGPDQDER